MGTSYKTQNEIHEKLCGCVSHDKILSLNINNQIVNVAFLVCFSTNLKSKNFPKFQNGDSKNL